MKNLILVIMILIGSLSTSIADEHTPMDMTQHLYDRALIEIEKGDKDFGCRVLRDALLSSNDIDDGYETYTAIWQIGTKLCNWMQNPTVQETSIPKHR